MDFNKFPPNYYISDQKIIIIIMIPIKNIVLVKINKRYANKKNIFMKKNQKNCIFKFNNNAK